MTRGRPPFKPTDEQRRAVAILSAAGTRHQLIARAFRLTVKTLAKHFRKELREGRADVNALVAKSLILKALSGDVTSIIWYEKTRAGFNEKSYFEHSAAVPPKLGISFANGGPGAGNPSAVDVSTSAGLEHIELRGQNDAPTSHAIGRPPNHVDPVPRIEQKSSAENWALLALPADEFLRLKARQIQEPDLHVHEHQPKPDAICPKCRALWVAL